MDIEASAAPQLRQAALGASKPLVREVPLLSAMQDVPEFWQAWQEGNGLGHAPLKDLPADKIRAWKQRYSEWSKAARALEGRAQEACVEPAQMAVTMEAERAAQKSHVANYLKGVGSSWLAQQRAAANAALLADHMHE